MRIRSDIGDPVFALNDEIRGKLKMQGLSQRDIARYIGITPSMMSTIIKNGSANLDRMKEIVRLAGIEEGNEMDYLTQVGMVGSVQQISTIRSAELAQQRIDLIRYITEMPEADVGYWLSMLSADAQPIPHKQRIHQIISMLLNTPTDFQDIKKIEEVLNSRTQ